MKRIIAALLLLAAPVMAHAQFAPLSGDIDRLLNDLSGTVVKVENGTVYTDVGQSDGAVAGLRLPVYRQGEVIEHPVTGEVLGRKRTAVGTFEVRDVYDNVSVGTVSGQAPVVGDIVELPRPLAVTLTLQDIDEADAGAIRAAVSRSKRIALSTDADIALRFTGGDGGVQMDILGSGGETQLFSRFYATAAAAPAAAGGDELVMGRIMKSKRFSGTYRSLALGRLKPGVLTYIAASTDEKVTVFGWDGESVTEHESIEDGFDEVLNVEVMDMNGNGVAELVIVTVDSHHDINTHIYEYANGAFALVQKNIPFLVRGTWSMGDKVLLAQRISRDGTYTGRIFRFGFENGEYRRTGSFEGSEGLALYGFAPIQIDDDPAMEMASIDLFAKLTIRDGADVIAEAAERFGETPHFFTITGLIKRERTLGPGEEYDPTADTMENFDESFTERRYLRPRIMQDNEGRIYTMENEPKARAFYRSTGYEKAVLAAWRLEGGVFRSVWRPDTLPAVIADMTFTLKDGATWVAAAHNVPGGFLGRDGTEFMFIEVVSP